MIIEAIKDIKSRTGCSRVAIFKFIKEKYDIGDEKRATMYMKLALKKGLESGVFKMARDEGKNSNKSKEKASAKRNSIGTPKIKKPIKKATATTKGKGGAGEKADKTSKGGKKPAAKASGTTKKASAVTKKASSTAKPKKSTSGKANAKK